MSRLPGTHAIIEKETSDNKRRLKRERFWAGFRGGKPSFLRVHVVSMCFVPLIIEALKNEFSRVSVAPAYEERWTFFCVFVCEREGEGGEGGRGLSSPGQIERTPAKV